MSFLLFDVVNGYSSSLTEVNILINKWMCVILFNVLMDFLQVKKKMFNK